MAEEMVDDGQSRVVTALCEKSRTVASGVSRRPVLSIHISLQGLGLSKLAVSTDDTGEIRKLHRSIVSQYILSQLIVLAFRRLVYQKKTISGR